MTRSRRWAAGPALLSMLLALLTPLGGAPSAHAYPGGDVDFTGFGWGHGRGMGQWGSLGYALDHGWNYTQIVDHFYKGTSMGTIGNIGMSVRLVKFDGKDTVVQQERGQLKTNAAGGTFGALRAVRTGSNSFRVDKAANCSGPWTTLANNVSEPVTFQPGSPSDDRRDMLQVCEPGGARRWMRGDIHAIDDGGTQRTVNHLGIENYLRGVVPRESPASWGNLGGGKGMHALRAQSIAARSYSASENRYSYAKTCDTTSCQVYGGVAVQSGATFTHLEQGNTDAAIRDTAGKVRKHSNGNVARTEFSSSTGGYTAGGTFAAVRDDGDDICNNEACNPNHTWRASVPVSRVEQAWPTIGKLSAMFVTARNGLGAAGGRVDTVRIEGTNRTINVTGNDVRSKLGLKSDWFSILSPSGYWIAADDGGVFSFGNAAFHGSMGGKPLDQAIVGMAGTPSGQGYWLVARDGGIFSFGDARFFGSTGGTRLDKPIVGMAPTSTGKGYWLVASDGGIFTFGDAKFFGSMGGKPLVQPVVGMAPTPTGKGYWMVALDGGIFTFGDAKFHGSMGGKPLDEPMVGIAATASGKGYWTVATDGGIFTFGDAKFHGSMGGKPLDRPMKSVAPTSTGAGYWTVAEDGGVFTFGDAVYWGAVPGVAPSSRTKKVAIVPTLPTG